MTTEESSRKLNEEDALQFIKIVQYAFRDEREKYYDFLEVLKDFRAQRIDTKSVTARVKELFKGRPGLILRFNDFLPKGYEINLSSMEEELQPPLPNHRQDEFEEAINFLNRIKARFGGDEHVYNSFVNILNQYTRGGKSYSEVFWEVSVLLQDHPDLIADFANYRPRSVS